MTRVCLIAPCQASRDRALSAKWTGAKGSDRGRKAADSNLLLSAVSRFPQGAQAFAARMCCDGDGRDDAQWFFLKIKRHARAHRVHRESVTVSVRNG